ncbi:MAG: hypothetical protein FWG74_00485 [Planctomycetes bacterium]|nr:hypothetical protein [Planctomycetota bacterium]
MRMACPDCVLVYRIRNLVPDKRYNCKRCGSELRLLTLDEGERIIRPEAVREGSEVIIAGINREASSSAQQAVPELRPAGRRRPISENADPVDVAGGRRLILEWLESLALSLKSLDSRLADGFSDLDEKADRLLARMDQDSLIALAEQVKEAKALFSAWHDEFREARKREVLGFADSAGPGCGQERTLAVCLSELGERLATGVGTRVVDEVMREQRANSSRLDGLTGEIKNAVARFVGLDEWRNELSHRVADEIGRTLEDRVTGSISGAVARQLPVVFSELQDNKLGEVVSRSVREAQRPLLREIVTGGRGVPVWLFASVLLPLLLILGYLILPGELGNDDARAGLAAVSESLFRLESMGVPLAGVDAERLRGVEEVVLDLHGEAMAHVKNTATLEEQIKNLHARLEEREALVNEYRETLQRQVRLLSSYRTRLTQLGVAPETIQE